MEEERGYIKPFNISLMKTQEETLKLFTDDELLNLLRKPKKTDTFVEWRMWAMVNWILGTGNRISTVCSIKLGDVDFTYKEIAIQYTKNNRAQTIPLSPALESVLREYIKMWRYNVGPDAWLFPTVDELQIYPNNVKTTFIKFCKDRGVNHSNWHGLRHNFAKGWIKNNGNVFALQKILGHSTLDMTKRYVKLFNEDLKENYGQFSPLDTIAQPRERKHKVKRA
jgi:integrase/recombinase XerD